MATADDEAAALRAEVSALRLRVQELERENQRLAKVSSSCTCRRKQKDSAASFPVASLSLYGNNPEAHMNQKFHESSTAEKDLSFPFDHIVLPSEIEVQYKGNTEGNGLPNDSSKHTNRKGRKVGNVSHCSKRLVALKVMYFGQRFYGFASEGQVEPTVESEVFKALERARLLVDNRKESCYSRCGRTDKGVSATGQVISLYLRSNIKDIGGGVLDERSEIDYVKVLNRVLPQDIRVLGWCPVPADFHARFTCLGREYKYLFWKRELDIVKMQKAASKFIGEHDFRNFCKMDAANVSNYRRRITEFYISACDKRSNNDELCSMTIKGSAFVWHQVRCMVSVLFLVGQGLESPSIVDSLLDITKTPRKPQYKMASELPLILRSCLFDKVNFMCSADANRSLIEHFNDEYRHYMLQAAIFHEALSCLTFPESNSLDTLQKKRNHIPLMSRQTEPSYEERIAKVKTKSADNQ